VAASTLARWRLPDDLDRTIGKEGVGRCASRRVGCANDSGAKKGEGGTAVTQHILKGGGCHGG
jgi:hypothetical protein